MDGVDNGESQSNQHEPDDQQGGGSRGDSNGDVDNDGADLNPKDKSLGIFS